MDIDEVFQKIGECGKGQLKIYAVLAVYGAVYTSFHLLQLVYTGAVPKHIVCNSSVLINGEHKVLGEVPLDKPTNNKSQLNSYCMDYSDPLHPQKCSAFLYNDSFTSIVTQWDLVCDSAWEATTVQSLFMLGVMIGSPIFGSLSDKIGRLKCIYISGAMLTLFGFASSFAWNVMSYGVLRLIVGASCAGLILAGYCLCIEIVGPSKRHVAGILGSFVFAIGILIFTLLAYFITNWRILSVVTALAGVVYFIFYRLLFESPRWLLMHGRTAECGQALVKIARMNGVKYPENVSLKRPTVTQRATMMDIFKSSVLRYRSIIMLYSWFVNGAVYYGLTFAAGDLGSNIYASESLSAIVEIPAYVVVLAVVNRIGRKKPLCAFMIVGGLGCLTILALPHQVHLFGRVDIEMIRTVCALIGKIGISASFNIIYIHSAELYPTTVRNAGMGLCAVGSRLGGVLCPYVGLLGKYIPNSQFIVFGFLSFTSGLLNMLLPETVNTTLPETIQDLGTIKKGTYEQVNQELDNPAKVHMIEEVIAMGEKELSSDNDEDDIIYDSKLSERQPII